MARGWKYAATSVVGTSHLKSPNGECQDSHCYSYDINRDLLVCVVSDGAGSATHSAIGSRVASSLAVEFINSAADQTLEDLEFARNAITRVRDSLVIEAAEKKLRLRDFACTLLVAIVHGPKTTFWQIGDGAICFRRQGDDRFNYAFWPAKGEYANVTQFITDENFLEALEFDSSQVEVADLALFSDGLERLALDFKTGEAHTKFFMGLFPYLYAEDPGHLTGIETQLKDFLLSERINSKTDDDKTLILATTEAQ